MNKKLLFCIAIFIFSFSCTNERVTGLRISDNHRYLETRDGKPFFWLGDTGWLADWYRSWYVA